MAGKKRMCNAKGCDSPVHPIYIRYYGGKFEPIRQLLDKRIYLRAYYCTKCQGLKWLKE